MVSSNTQDFLDNQLKYNISEAVIDKVEKETGVEIDLYNVSELRPLIFSKTVTLFDVYETDEENFEPYISPLATVGTIPSSSTNTTDTNSSIEDTSTTDETTEETSGGGLLGGIL